MDLFGSERRRLRMELDALRAENESLAAAKHKASGRASERQRKLQELERIIDDLRGELARLKTGGASSSQVTAAQKALDDAVAIHSKGSR